MGRTTASFQRRNPRFIAKAKVFIICEDSKSSKTYLEDAKKHFDIDAKVEVAHVGKTDPLGIVTTAIDRMGEYERIYCVIDRDTHPNFIAAVNLCSQYERIELVISYPCFEYWIMLHFQENRKAFGMAGKKSPGAQMIGELKKIDEMGGYDKGAVTGLFGKLLDRLPPAVERATRILDDAIQVNQMNPSTRMHELLQAFEVLSRSRK